MTISSPFIRTLTCCAIAALLVLSCQPAHARSWELPNEAGGKIVITTRPCPNAVAPDLLEAYSFATGGRVVRGCWALIDGLVHIAWGYGVRRIFRVEDFTPADAVAPAPARPATPGRYRPA